MSEAALFKAQLGACWQQVHPDIQARFDADPLPGQPIYYDGCMTRVECSRLGAALAWVSGLFTTGALCPWRGMDVPAFITVYKEPGCDDILKLRRYEFPGGRSYLFRSRMHAAANGELLEFVGGGMGMRVTVQERNGALFFTNGGYFIGTKAWQIRLPALLSPGKVELTHANLSRDRFTISIRITHPWFGVLYEQEGEFQRRIAEHALRLFNWRPGLKTVYLVHAVRCYSTLSLTFAKKQVESFLSGEKVVLYFMSEAQKNDFKREAFMLGVDVVEVKPPPNIN